MARGLVVALFGCGRSFALSIPSVSEQQDSGLSRSDGRGVLVANSTMGDGKRWREREKVAAGEIGLGLEKSG